MRYLFGFMCVCALGVMPLVGCSETGGTGGTGGMPECQSPEDCDDGNECTVGTCANGACDSTPVTDGTACDDGNECTVGTCANGACDSTPVTDGTACDESNECTTGMCADGTCDATPVQDGTACGDDAGTCQQGSCVGTFACTEQGIREAIAVGGGPHTFDCAAGTTIVTKAEIFIDNDVILDGEGQLTLVGDEDHAVFVSLQNLNDPPATAELRGFRVIGGAQHFMGPLYAVYLAGEAALTLTDSTVSGSLGAGIEMDGGRLTLLRSSISNNTVGVVSSFGIVTIRNSTVSGNDRNVVSALSLMVVNSTISGGEVGISNLGQMTIRNSTIASEGQAFETADGDYDPPPEATFANTVVVGGCEGDVANHVTSNGYNIESSGNTCGFDQSTDMPGMTAEQLNLGPLTDNGGPTMTHKPGDGGLREGSVAIDRIPGDSCDVTEDQRGKPRPETGGTMCDVGSVEVQPEP
jgi:hypothetical protein